MNKAIQYIGYGLLIIIFILWAILGYRTTENNMQKIPEIHKDIQEIKRHLGLKTS